MRANILTAFGVGTLTILSAMFNASSASACPDGDQKPKLACPGDKKPSLTCPGDKKPSLTCPDDKKPKAS